MLLITSVLKLVKNLVIIKSKGSMSRLQVIDEVGRGKYDGLWTVAAAHLPARNKEENILEIVFVMKHERIEIACRLVQCNFTNNLRKSLS